MDGILGTDTLSTARTRDSVAPIVAQDLVDEAQDVAGVGVAHRMATKAQRVNTSMAVSWHTLPTPLSL